MKRIGIPGLLLLLACAFALPSGVGATVMFERSIEEMTRDADCVVVATPSGQRRSYWRGGRIATDVTVRVTAVLAGAAVQGELLVRLPGGVVGDIGQSVAGSPELPAGTPVVLFLSAPLDGARTVVSMAAGVFPLSLNPLGELRVLPPHADGITFIVAPTAAPTPGPRPRVALPPQGEPLATFVARLRSGSR